MDYDTHYRKGRGQCGDPFPEFRAFFEGDRPRSRVLDLGCGQGRDALLAARHGHEVVGVDLSEIGISQMVEDAEAEGLEVTGIVSDVLSFRSRRKFDVVLLDRVLHLLLDDDERLAGLGLAARLTRKGGHVLIADVPKNRALIHDYFDARPGAWEVVKRTKSFLFARRIRGS
ncbi:MAG: class I SAM-dependent methyltransferase [Nannocystaceae bacterium]|nr:class I SAM-dependent methyltransferase [bacterium]